jgi:hypothetical protein
MQFLIRSIWFFSLLGFLYNLYTTYGNIQEVLVLEFASTGFAVTRSQYFFFFVGFFTVLNVLLFVLGKMVSFIPKSFFWVPNASYWTSSSYLRACANNILSNWTWVIAATANYFMIFWMLVIENRYHFEGGSIAATNWFHIPGLIMAGSLVLPFLRFFSKNPNYLARPERD